MSNVTNPGNPRFNTPGGEDTEDKVFLLSISEASDNDYGFKDEFSVSDNARQCKSSSYAKAMGIYLMMITQAIAGGGCARRASILIMLRTSTSATGATIAVIASYSTMTAFGPR